MEAQGVQREKEEEPPSFFEKGRRQIGDTLRPFLKRTCPSVDLTLLWGTVKMIRTGDWTGIDSTSLSIFRVVAIVLWSRLLRMRRLLPSIFEGEELNTEGTTL